MATRKQDALAVLGEEAEELIEELEKLARRARTKSRTSGMVLKANADERMAALAKIKELRRKLDKIEAELTDSDFERKWGNQSEPKQHRVRVWDTGEGGRIS